MTDGLTPLSEYCSPSLNWWCSHFIMVLQDVLIKEVKYEMCDPDLCSVIKHIILDAPAFYPICLNQWLKEVQRITFFRFYWTFICGGFNPYWFRYSPSSHQPILQFTDSFIWIKEVVIYHPGKIGNNIFIYYLTQFLRWWWQCQLSLLFTLISLVAINIITWYDTMHTGSGQ